jgi:hypothetical protein
MSASHGDEDQRDQQRDASGDPPSKPESSAAGRRPQQVDKGEILARLARLVAAADPRHSLPERLAEACRQLLDVDGTAITLENTSLERITLWTTDEAAARLEDLQEVVGQGPSHQAFTTGEAVVARLDHDERRWPDFTDSARRVADGATIYALPIRPNLDVIGVLALHQLPPATASPSLAGAQFLADAIGAALLADPPSADQPFEDGPWSSRAEIHQATGIVVAQLRLVPADALAILRAHAFAHDATLHDIATQVITGQLDFGSDSSESL